MADGSQGWDSVNLSFGNTLAQCHAERDEASLTLEVETLRSAQGIMIGCSDKITKVVLEEKEIANF